MMTENPAFVPFAITSVVLGLQMVLLDAYSGVNRAKSRTTPNREDASTVAKGAELVAHDPDGVARVMRAHRNLLANATPFLILSFVWVLLGASRAWAIPLFATFVGARLIHSFAYVSAKQPWRTLSFVVGQTALAVVAIQIVRAVV
jgi:uncharacterized MAPEG superfamily protein